MSEPLVIGPGYRADSFIFEQNIGDGAFASVWRARHEISQAAVAIKVIEKSTVATPVASTRLQREIALLKKMDHPFIAEFFKSFEDADRYYLVMEYVENGNLLDYVNGKGCLSEDQSRRYFAQLISVLEYLHCDQKVAHRDLKCENILLDRYQNIRVIDFGLSNVFSEGTQELKTACGSPAYASPEMVKGQTYTRSADIWSAGILLYAIVVGNLPFDDGNIQRLLQKIVYTDPTYPASLSPPLIDLLQKMLSKTPETRASIERIKNHPWFSQTEYQVLLQNNALNTRTRDSLGENGIDKEIIDKMTGLGIDCRQLHASLLNDDFTDLTSLYRIFVRQKMTEKMKNIMQPGQGGSGLVNAQGKAPVPLMPTGGRPGGKTTSPFCCPPRPRNPPSARALNPKPGLPQAVLATPVQAVHGGRRLSRPVACRRPVNTMPNSTRGAHETP